MRYKIHYSCSSHVGKVRSMNQDNFICDGKYMEDNNVPPTFPLIGTVTADQSFIIGVFDGMGGEECGEVASYIAAKCAAEASIGEKSLDDLLEFCKNANEKICDYATENGIFAMGTTAALLVFNKTEITLCNIGDSKIFRFANKKLEQISIDDYAVTVQGLKPPLSQNLGIPALEMVIEPHVARSQYNDGDLYLICSDGLTDMVTVDVITKILLETQFNKCVNKLQETALENGGKDNITIILCKVEREKWILFNRLFLLSKKEDGGTGSGR